MKCYEVLWNSVRAGCTTPISDLEMRINVHGKVLAAGTYFFNSLHIVRLCLLSIMLQPVGLGRSY